MAIEVRDYVGSDYDFVRSCYSDYLAEERSRVPLLGIPDTFADTYLPRLLQKVQDQNGVFLMATIDGTQCGYAAALPKDPQAWDQTSGKVIMIMDLYVVPAHRRQGIGRLLFGAIERHFVDKEFGWFTLGVMAKNDRARSFYKAMGYGETYVMMGKSLR